MLLLWSSHQWFSTVPCVHAIAQITPLTVIYEGWPLTFSQRVSLTKIPTSIQDPAVGGPRLGVSLRDLSIKLKYIVHWINATTLQPTSPSPAKLVVFHFPIEVSLRVQTHQSQGVRLTALSKLSLVTLFLTLCVCVCFCICMCLCVCFLSLKLSTPWSPSLPLWGGFCTMCLWFSGSFQGKESREASPSSSLPSLHVVVLCFLTLSEPKTTE